MIAGDREGVRRGAISIGYMSEDEREERQRAIVDLILLVGQPLRKPGIYDFARSNLPSRVRDAGLDLVFRHGFLQPPPPETVFLHRKLVGSFLLCARIRAQVNVQELVLPLVESALSHTADGEID